jgi:hypothetical protein
MKKIIFISVVFFLAMSVNAQETFFPTKEGRVLVYKSFNKKDKLSNTIVYTVKHVTVNGSDVDITYQCESMDPHNKLIFNEEITIHQKGDVLYLDMSNFVNKAAFQKNGEMPADVQIKGNKMEIPMNLASGESLPDASVEMSLNMGLIKMKVSADVTNRKVEAIEDITVQAGTFKCYKISSKINTVSMGFKVQSSNIEWFAKGVGMIKNETYDKNGVLQSHTELVELK